LTHGHPHHARGTFETRKAIGKLVHDNLTAHFAGETANPGIVRKPMKSIVIHAAKDLRIEERPVSEPGPGEVEIAIATGGICGSDLHYYNHGGFGAVRLKEPMILGHEVAGHITRLGSNVSGLSVGQLVAVSPSRPCFTCRYCKEGRHNQCLNMRFYGSAMPFPHIQGAFREVLVADQRQCAPADGLTPGEAAMAEPLAVCLHATRQAGEMLGKRVLVAGCGPIGLLSILAARRAGASEIVATDLSDFTLKMARDNGADRTVNMAREPGGLKSYEVNKGTFDVLYECTGAAPALAAGIAALRPGGVIVQLGLGGDMQVPVQTITAKELQLRGSFRFHEEFFIGVELLRKGLIDVKPLITHTMRIDEAVAAFEIASDRSQAMKAQIAFG
jgi:L-idonate 5-dehydrogenase